MIRRFLCLLLVLLMQANQGQCFAHAHQGTDVTDTEGHAARAHFHFGRHGQCDSTHNRKHHADHSGHDQELDDGDTALPPTIASLGDHDADAVYFAEVVTFARGGRVMTIVSARYFAASAILPSTHQNGDWLLRLGPLRGRPPSVFDAACPIYLLTLSLRI